jgi:hypothetical protein
MTPVGDHADGGASPPSSDIGIGVVAVEGAIHMAPKGAVNTRDGEESQFEAVVSRVGSFWTASPTCCSASLRS